tara:strand:+ start:20519 stop:21652 length:1134 start_codon:yes stop_codon:yes gene_type:complete
MDMQIYLDHAASSPLHPKALKAMMPYLGLSYGNPSSVHSFGRKQKAAIENVRKSIANHLGAKSSEIYFCSSGTEANNIALKLAVQDLNVERIITSHVEHKCVLNTAKFLKNQHNIEVEYLDLGIYGQVDLNHLEKLLLKSNKKTLVSIMHIQNELGSINNIDRIGELCKQSDAFFHSDTVQSIGHYSLNLENLNISFLSASAHKFNGPLGIGFLYKKSTIALSPWLHGGGHERNLRSSTENVPGIVGMGEALKIAYANLEKDKAQINKIKTQLKNGLLAIHKEILFNEIPEETTYTILSCSIPNRLINDTFTIQLDMAGISVSTGSACSSGAVKGSNVLEFLNLNTDYSTFRFSFSTFTKSGEIDYVLDFFREELGN